MKLGLWACSAFAAIMIVGCGSGDSGGSTSTTPGTTAEKPAGTTAGNLPLVVFSQANSADPWRQQFDAETKAAAEANKSAFKFEEQAAEDDPNKQISQIDTLMLESPKVLLVSPAEMSVRTAIEKAFDKGTSVILLDRGIPGDKYTVHIGGDNVEIGKQAGEYIAKRLNGKGIVLMIQGKGGADATNDRREGAMAAFKKFPGISVIQGDDCKYQRQAAQSYMETFLQTGKPFDAVYAHNDEMAIGAYQAYDHAATKPKTKPIFVGVDGCQQEVVQMIKDGKLDATFRYPDPGPKGIEVAAEILKGNKPKDKKIILPTELVDKSNADKYLAAHPGLAK